MFFFRVCVGERKDSTEALTLIPYMLIETLILNLKFFPTLKHSDFGV